MQICLCKANAAAQITAIHLSPAQGKRIAERVRFNETADKYEALVHWNQGELHPSLGIGHFIWYPKQVEARFSASFPELMAYFKQKGLRLPHWLQPNAHCPWPDRASFLIAQQNDTEQIQALYALMASTVHLQVEFMILRLNQALPTMLSRIKSPKQKQRIRQAFTAVLFNGKRETDAVSEHGAYALLDYVNFKGEGVNPNERYQGEGWGLLQVLEQVDPADPSPLVAFSQAAKHVLQRRIDQSPPSKNEVRWRAGWFKRVEGYAYISN